MEILLLFAILSIPTIFISWRTFFKVKNHGFYRFFSWECLIWLFASNYKYWFEKPFSFYQIISWILLIISAYLAITGIILLKKATKPEKLRIDDALFKFEKTTELVDYGIYKYIRHPLYSSLIFLNFGVYFKNTNNQLLIIAVISTVFLYLTAFFDEKECIQYFGKKYEDYIKRSKMFIPFML